MWSHLAFLPTRSIHAFEVHKKSIKGLGLFILILISSFTVISYVSIALFWFAILGIDFFMYPLMVKVTFDLAQNQ